MNTKTMSDVAYQRVRDDIISGALKPGEKLKVADLVERYDIGASPLREALARLSAAYLVSFEGQRGFTVAPVSAQELKELSDLRQMIEALALSRSIEAGDEAWESRIVAAYYRLQKADHRVSESPDASSLSEWEERNRDFHEALTSACDSAWLLRLQKLLYAQHERYRRLAVINRRPSREIDKEHKALLDACLSRDTDVAAKVMGEHIGKTVLSLSPLLEQGTQQESPRSRRKVG
ncbi:MULTISPECIES: GntR family transcriptional regulator [Rhizobium]|nr:MULTISPECIES: FCD domain-containing protein [Rhizobium]